ncbi:uncharacterized protein LOC131303070 [Rhododendron vialii]|uniref:uncharacterized protein LOC131303070 n=1 Tax=Rhododendron vialii TaxID=182163 RepID=UPI00265F7A48|nr:uncharacterized protein LOC131303070 [Rhododendron vialii]
MCRRLVEAIPNIRAIWTSTDEGKFKQLFVSYGCSIAAFRSGNLRPILKLDACFLTRYYRGHVLSASAHDADDGLYPLAYAIVSSENDEDWLWFLVNLKEVLGGCQVVLVTDRNISLLNCIIKVVNDLAYARTEDSFKYHLAKLYGISPDLSKWVEDNNPKHWSNAFFPYKRWDKMYTNLAECFNSWILPLRELDIIQFMMGHVSKTNELLLHKHTEVRKWKLPVGKEIEKETKKSQEYARKFTHRNSSPIEFIVANDTRKLYAVKLIPRHCSCLAWQMSGIPCAHAARAIQSSGFSIYDMVDPFLKKEMQMAIYDNTMSPVPLHDMPSPSSFLAVNELNDNNVNNGVSSDVANQGTTVAHANPQYRDDRCILRILIKVAAEKKENLQHWLTDEKARDQFVIRSSSDTEVLWNDARHLKPDPIYKRQLSCYHPSFVLSS